MLAKYPQQPQIDRRPIRRQNNNLLYGEEEYFIIPETNIGFIIFLVFENMFERICFQWFVPEPSGRALLSVPSDVLYVTSHTENLAPNF